MTSDAVTINVTTSGWEWLPKILNTNSALLTLTLNALMIEGTVDPAGLAKMLNALQRDLERGVDDPTKDASVASLQMLRENLFGKNDSKLRALRAQLRLRHQRRNRIRYARYHDGI